MKRDRRLRGLSDDHHQALVLGRRILRGLEAGEVDWIAERVERTFRTELAPHFEVEESILVPAMEEAGLHSLTQRLGQDHSHLRASAAAAAQGDLEAAGTFARLLIEHVRFEERVVFPQVERALEGEVLDAVAARACNGT